jgi:hypothetical protein
MKVTDRLGGLSPEIRLRIRNLEHHFSLERFTFSTKSTIALNLDRELLRSQLMGIERLCRMNRGERFGGISSG